MDFGIAYRPDSGEIPLPPGVILGTPAYVAPEQAQGGQTDVLPASDQYSLGAVLYELLSGQPPFCGPPSYVIFHTIHHDPTATPHRRPQGPAHACLPSARRPWPRGPKTGTQAVKTLRRTCGAGFGVKPLQLIAAAAGLDRADNEIGC